jgi:hypothetical protein
MRSMVITKHGFKARKVTEAQEQAMDSIASNRFRDPISQVDVLNESFHNSVVVTVTDGENERVHAIIAQDGTTALVAH